MPSKTRSRTRARPVQEFSGKQRAPVVEKNRRGIIRIWWGDWACTIRSGHKLRFNHLHDLTYYSGRGGETSGFKCRCGENVPEELFRMAKLQQIGQARDSGEL